MIFGRLSEVHQQNAEDRGTCRLRGVGDRIRARRDDREVVKSTTITLSAGMLTCCLASRAAKCFFFMRNVEALLYVL